MVKISLMYPNTKNARFDMNYYITSHMPMSIERLSASPSFRGVSVERGLGGAGPDTQPPYIAMCHYLFDSLEDFLAAFQPHAAVLQGDMLRYTDLEPVMQVSAVEIVR